MTGERVDQKRKDTQRLCASLRFKPYGRGMPLMRKGDLISARGVMT